MPLKIPKIHHFSTPFPFCEKKCEYNIPLEMVFLEGCPLLKFLVEFRPEDFFGGQVSFPELQVW